MIKKEIYPSFSHTYMSLPVIEYSLTLFSSSDIRNVAGFCNIHASSRSSRQTSLVPWEGMILLPWPNVMCSVCERHVFGLFWTWQWHYNILQEWSYLRGGLTTLDRDYGWMNNIHHDIGTHVIHHLFPQIPHYHLIEAVSSSLL